MDVETPSFNGDELFGLFDLSLLAKAGMHEWLAESLNRCTHFFRASGGSVFLVDEDGHIRLKVKSGAQCRIPDAAEVEIGVGVAGTVLLDGAPRIIGDPTAEPFLVGKGVVKRSEVDSSMVVPLLGPSGESVGVLNLSRAKGEGPFDEHDLSNAAKLGAHVALAVTNAQLVNLLQSALDDRAMKLEQLQAVLDSVAGSVYVVDGAGRYADDTVPEGAVGTAAACVLEGVRITGEPQEGRAYAADTDSTWLLNAVPLSFGGAVLTVQDITQYQRAQNDAARLKRLAEIGQMAAAIAHEIRNPLTGIRGAAQLIAADESFAGEYSKVIEDEAVKLEALCSDFLEISRPLRLELGSARLGDVVKRVCGLWRPEFEHANVCLTLESAADDPTMTIDVRRVEQVVHNLVKNALQACKPGGRVGVKVAEGSLSIQDDGVGMDEETQNRLFSPFFSTKPSGTGLGLCNIRRIVDAHGGGVDVWSEPGKGTRFEVSFGKNVA
ncbi:MAG: GAF domain-containing protein [Armatimonadetes bacterium]|nr:GAF domain-containing protein [Armatimonadota bacterium]